MAPAIKCLIVLAIVALLFITELIPLAITAMSDGVEGQMQIEDFPEVMP